jgi:hypothetical protein
LLTQTFSTRHGRNIATSDTVKEYPSIFKVSSSSGRNLSTWEINLHEVKNNTINFHNPLGKENKESKSYNEKKRRKEKCKSNLQ